MLAHIPGLKVVVPSDPYSVKGLLAAAIRDDDPVFLVNDKKLINLTGFVPDEDYIIELGKGRYMRRGTDVTLVGMSYTSIACQKAADQLAEIGIDAEVIDMMSLSPFDEDIIIESVTKTNNVVIVDEDTPRASMASEFAAIIADKAFDALDSPVKRVTSPHAPVPYNRDLEQAFMPQPEDIIGTVKNILGRD
jgi:pyruvate dehydrogenase E1 component beta subunit